MRPEHDISPTRLSPPPSCAGRLSGRPSWVGRLGRVRERLFTTMNASARIETRAEVGSEVHFSHDVSERLVMKDEETAAEPMGGIEQPLLTPRRRTFTLTPLPPRRPSPDAAALRTEPTTTPFDQNVTSRTQHARQATPVPEPMGAQDQLAALQLRAAMAEATARLVAAELAAAGCCSTARRSGGSCTTSCGGVATLRPTTSG